MLAIAFTDMATSDHEESSKSGNQAPETIGPFQKKSRTFDIGTLSASTKKTTWVNVNQAIIPKENTYTYEPMDYHEEIRILKIVHGKKNAPVECMLYRSALQASTYNPSLSLLETYPYWALSYWWGDDEPSNPIRIYQDTRVRTSLQEFALLNLSGIFYVRNNLYAALKHFRKEDRDVDIWADALCINQKDNDEKTAQVARMHEIYSDAENVSVWLGSGNPQAKETFEFLRTILDLKKLDDLVTNKTDPEKWMLVINLMKNKWFSRRWVIQELALARSATVHWGGAKIPWSNFADAIALFMTKHDSITEMLGKPESFVAMQENDGALDPRALGASTLVNATSNLFRRSLDGKIHQRLLSLEVLVSSLFLPFEASEPKDTIYAVLSLAKDTSARIDLTETPSWLIKHPHKIVIWIMWFLHLLPRCIHFLFTLLRHWKKSSHAAPARRKATPPIDARVSPNYDKTLMEVYADFMEYCIEKSNSFDILCRHWAPLPKELTGRQKFELLKAGRKEEKETLPTWIPTIDGHAYGGPSGVLNGRKHGDSLVGGLERLNQQHYNASEDLKPYVRFGKPPIPNNKGNGKDNNTTTPKANITSPVNLPPIPEPYNNPTNPRNPKETKLRPTSPTHVAKRFDGTLEVKGFYLDVIGEKLTGRVVHGVIPVEAFQYGGWTSKPDDEVTPDHVPDQLWRTLVADRGPNGTNAPTWYRRACLECLMHTNPNGDFNTQEFKHLSDTPITMKLFLERVRSVIWCRKFFLTDGRGIHKPYFGLAPPGTKQGDLIFIIFGCSVPVVLRKLPGKGNERYNFIGECYVHGNMDGEALPLAKRPKWPYKDVQGFTLV